MVQILGKFTVFVFTLSALGAQENLKFGNPGCTGPDLEEANRRVFELCHNSDLRVPMWVGYELKRSDLNGPADRTDNFRQDPDLTKPGSRDSDYVRSGYSRGHMAPAEDFSRSAEAMRTSFLLSNIVPQFQGVNGGRWAQLELAVRKITQEAGIAYIFTGPIFAKRIVETIGDDEVGIPTHTFKVVLAIKSDGSKKMYASIMPNAEKVTKPVNFFATTVREVERRTGLDFFSLLPDGEEKMLESKKELFPESGKKKQPKGHS